ncbi:MAG: hypothetical protein AAF633_04765 [Chloroflexota bacterium]
MALFLMMPQANHKIGDTFKLQFVWQLPHKGFARAVFNAKVEAFDHFQERYIVFLERLLAKREEDADGTMLDVQQWAQGYWELIAGLEGRRVAVGYEAQDGRPLRLRLATLTLEHGFFTKYS